MVKNTCFLNSFEEHILSPDVHPGNDEPYAGFFLLLDEFEVNLGLTCIEVYFGSS